MELQLERLFDGPPPNYLALCQAASMAPVAEPLSFRHFSREMLQVRGSPVLALPAWQQTCSLFQVWLLCGHCIGGPPALIVAGYAPMITYQLMLWGSRAVQYAGMHMPRTLCAGSVRPGWLRLSPQHQGHGA